MRAYLILTVVLGLAATAIFYLLGGNSTYYSAGDIAAQLSGVNSGATSTIKSSQSINPIKPSGLPNSGADEVITEPLPNPPSIIRSVYFTKYSAAYEPRLKQLLNWASQG